MHACTGQAGTGGWLYGSMYGWDQVKTNASKAAMLADTTRMFNIRKNESDVVHSNQCTATVAAIAFKANAPDNHTDVLSKPPPKPGNDPWQPYARYTKGLKAVVVVGNPNNAPLALTLSIPLAAMGFSPTVSGKSTPAPVRTSLYIPVPVPVSLPENTSLQHCVVLEGGVAKLHSSSVRPRFLILVSRVIDDVFSYLVLLLTSFRISCY